MCMSSESMAGFIFSLIITVCGLVAIGFQYDLHTKEIDDLKSRVDNLYHPQPHTIYIKRHGDVPMPASYGDWIDLCAEETINLKAGEYKVIPLGVSMKLPSGYEAHLVPRSSTFNRYGIIQTNGVGIIDNAYCGNEDVWGMPVMAMRDTTINAGDRICQFKIVKKQPTAKFVETADLGRCNRGGFGSTGR